MSDRCRPLQTIADTEGDEDQAKLALDRAKLLALDRAKLLALDLAKLDAATGRLVPVPACMHVCVCVRARACVCASLLVVHARACSSSLPTNMP